MDLMRIAITIDRISERLKPLPWIGYAIVLAVAFGAASLTSTLLSVFLFPSDKAQMTAPVVDEKRASDVPIRGTTLDKAGLDRIVSRNIFNSEGEKEDPNARKGPAAPSQDAVKSELQVKLIGLIYGGDPFSGIAIVQNTTKNQTNSFLVGDQIDRDAVVKEILQDRIIIENQGRKEFVMLEVSPIRRSTRSKGRGKPAGETTSASDRPMASGAPPDSYKEEGFSREKGDVEMTEAFKSKLLGPDFATVLQDAKADPNVVDNELRGFKLTRIRAGSIYEKAGFMNGDVIEEINGVSLTDANQAIRLLQSIRNEKEIEVRYNRNGAKYTTNLKVR